MPIKLRRSITLTGLVFYGVGTMVGGGIYALLGEVTSEAGIFSPWSMLIAGVLAIFSALTFAELSSRLPFSGGPARYITEAFRINFLGSVFGWLVIATGVVSAATLTVAISGFFLDLLSLPSELSKIMIVLILLGLASWGIKQSVLAVAIITLIEVIGLLLVVGVNVDLITSSEISMVEFIPDNDLLIWTGIIAGSFIAFYAFIGFEDMVTLAEEVKASEKNVPKAIIISLAITLVLYVIIAFVAVISADLPSFVESNTPMAYLVSRSTWLDPQVLVLVSLLAGFNGALVQVVMASRVLYGMGQEGQAPTYFSKLTKKNQTPVIASIAVAFMVFFLSVFFDLIVLAKLTSGIILFVFAAMNLSLIKIKMQNPDYSGFNIPFIVPILGFIVSLASLVLALVSSVGTSH